MYSLLHRGGIIHAHSSSSPQQARRLPPDGFALYCPNQHCPRAVLWPLCCSGSASSAAWGADHHHNPFPLPHLLHPCRWHALPPELLRAVVHSLLKDWSYPHAAASASALAPLRLACATWRTTLDADVQKLGPTHLHPDPQRLVDHFPSVTSLDLSCAHLGGQALFSVLRNLPLR